MRDALVFNGANNLDFQDIRANVIRIPEVIGRLREAQRIWDTVSSAPLDLANFVGGDDRVFLGNIRLKTFATAVVQIGLLDRFLKRQALPEFVMGTINGDSPLKVATGEQSFFDMVAESAAMGGGPEPILKVVSASELPVLAGVQLDQYAIYRRTEDGEFKRLKSEAREAERMIVELIDLHEVQRLVMVGPGNMVFGSKIADLTGRDVQVLESIDLDPMLSWFWSELKDNRLAIAN